VTLATFPHCCNCDTPDACEAAGRCASECRGCITPWQCSRLGCRKAIPEQARHFAAHAEAAGEPQPASPSTGEPLWICRDCEAPDACLKAACCAAAMDALIADSAQQIADMAPPRARILREAERLICGDREADYGPPAESFARAAAFATLATGHRLTPADVVRVLWAVKCSRLRHQPGHADSHVDRVAYDAILAEVPDDFAVTVAALSAAVSGQAASPLPEIAPTSPKPQQEPLL
jgi:hypothetical protein